MYLIQLLLPIAVPDQAGAVVTTALAETRRELTERFGGSTAYVRSPAKGLWAAPDGELEQDEVVMVEVVADVLDRNWWKEYTERLAVRFHQQVIHARAMPVDVLT
jgi:hypothetical protein